jgi:acyl-CoA reductase-like NAD-dependent aldehyde dehydrogenase
MAASAVPVDSLPSVNPATGEAMQYFPKTPPTQLAQIVSRARQVQTHWQNRPLKERCAQLRVLRDTVLSARDILADTVVRESGKPRVEALFADIFVALDTAAYFATHGERLLQPERVGHHSLAAKAKSGRLW